MDHDDTEVPELRQQHFDCDAAIEIYVDLGGGQLDVQLLDTELTTDTAGEGTLTVQVRVDPKARPPWSAGITGLLSWLGEQAGTMPSGDLGAEAIQHTVIDFTGQRLTVQTPRDAPLHAVPLIIQVSAPAGSSVTARSGSADITVDGVADRLHASTGSGQVRAQRCTGAVDIRTGSGDVRLGSLLGALRVRTGSGGIDVVSLAGAGGAGDHAGAVRTGSGDIRLGIVARDVTARTGSGDLTVGDASAGSLELTSGSGQLRVGIHTGVWAELDISTGSGQARSDLPISGPPADGTARLRVRGRTGSGDALVTAAPH